MDDKHLTLHHKEVGGPKMFVADYDSHQRLYWLHAKVQTRINPNESHWVMSASVPSSEYDLWHRRFGHAGKKALEELPGKVKGVPDHIKALAESSPCDGCEFGKSKRGAFPPSESRAANCLDLIHMDLVEYPINSIDNYKYTLTTLDDHSSYGMTWFLKHKSDALACFKSYVAWAENQSRRKVKAIRSDRGGEFLGKDFDDFLAERGIERQLSVQSSQSEMRKGEPGRPQAVLQALYCPGYPMHLRVPAQKAWPS